MTGWLHPWSVGAADRVDAWLLEVGPATDDLLRSLRSHLDVAERARSQRFVFDRDRVAFELAHGLARHALSRAAPAVAADEWRFTASARRRPEPAPPFDQHDLRFNLSHTQGLVACVVTRGLDCGVDVEVVDRRELGQGLAGRCLAPDELRHLRAAPDEPERWRRFVRYWTLKEAHAKATGEGLGLDFRTLAFDLAAMPTTGMSATPCPRPDGLWHAWQWSPGPDHEAAVCVRRRGDDRPRPAELRVHAGRSVVALLSRPRSAASG